MFVLNLSDQVVLVTGAGRGLGATIAKAFGQEGARVVVNYNKSEKQAKELAADIGIERAIAIKADIRDAYDVEKMFVIAKTHFGQGITTIVNNALVNFKFDANNRKDVDKIQWEDYQEQFDGNVKGAWNTIKFAKKDMVNKEFGRIINIGTNLVQNPVVAYHEYNTAKAALLGFTRNMAKDLGPKGITVNMVSAGLLQTTDASAATPPEVFELIKESSPLQKVTTPEDIANAVLFFASPWSRAITGQNLVVDGGLVMD